MGGGWVDISGDGGVLKRVVSPSSVRVDVNDDDGDDEEEVEMEVNAEGGEGLSSSSSSSPSSGSTRPRRLSMCNIDFELRFVPDGEPDRQSAGATLSASSTTM